jgi:alpha-1,3-rhamnosyl/mannosyltransferase
VSDYLGYDPNRDRWRWPRLYSRIQRLRPNHTFTPSEFSRQELIRFLGFHRKQVSVTPLAVPDLFTAPANPTEASKVRERLGLRQPYLLNVGGFEAHKNIPALLQVFAAVRKQRPDLSLAVVGTGRVPEKLIAAAGEFRGGVKFLSNLGDELLGVYDGAAAFVSMSWRESFGVPFLEAMARGVPVVASAWGASSEVVGTAGELIDPRDIEAATAAILRVLAEPHRYASAGRKQVATFSWKRTAELTAKVYQKLIWR